ncbi:MAG TPA: hypothetical protein VGC54_02520 [Planctomycetota bacterium]
MKERDASLSPRGDAFAYTLQGAQGTAIVLVERRGEAWGAPELAPFSAEFADIEPCFDPRGERLWFASQRPLLGEDEPGDWNLWTVDYARGASGLSWSEPKEVFPLNGPGDEFYPSVSREGEVAFTAEREGGRGGEDVWLARFGGGGWTTLNFGPGVNSAGPEFNACLRPDGTFGPARVWSALNSPFLDYCPSFSPDGAVLWFTSNRRAPREHEGRWPTLDALLPAQLAPGNGAGDLYWVSTRALDD